MIYAFTRNNETFLVALANGTHKEFMNVMKDIVDVTSELSEVDIIEQMMDDELAKFSRTIFALAAKDEQTLQDFNSTHGVILLHPARALDKHNDMIRAEEPDPYDVNDKRTVAELTGTDDHDPWDKRSEEEIEEDKKMKEIIEQMKKDGKVSEESFSPVTKDGVRVTDIRTVINKDGSISVDNVLARKFEAAESNAVLYVMTADGVKQFKADWQGTKVVATEDAREAVESETMSGMHVIANNGTVSSVTVGQDGLLVSEQEYQ